MNNSTFALLPSIHFDDVRWAAEVMGFSPDAFVGQDGLDQRAEILCCNESLDIEACPGSGKTTLLVAKLAILAKKWNDPHRGICVISHTNTARREIEKRLGGIAEGSRLLTYPHYVDTIHGFANSFLALPWIRSKPWPIKVIDDEVTLERRWNKLSHVARNYLNHAHRHRGKNALFVKNSNFDFAETLRISEDSCSCQNIKKVCKTSTLEGYFCYDEMFVWANELLDKFPQIVKVIRSRFPILFIDEVQDNNSLQSSFLFKVFTKGLPPVVRQRFGDSNQRIFDDRQDTAATEDDSFPDKAIRKIIPDSYRFGQEIANLAAPLALDCRRLVGNGPKDKRISADTAGKHALFLFDEETVTRVLPAYASYLMEVFSCEELRQGNFAAVGSVHKLSEGKMIPYSVCDYWPEYVPGLSSVRSNHDKLIPYVTHGLTLFAESGETHHVVNKIAEGVLEFIRICDFETKPKRTSYAHIQLIELLDNAPDIRAEYIKFVTDLICEPRSLKDSTWKKRWVPLFERLAMEVGDIKKLPAGARIKSFLKWGAPVQFEKQGALQQKDNIYRYPVEKPKVKIQVGSIHSIKGQTHTATLVMETFYRKLNLQSILDWIIGKRRGGRECKDDDVQRLKRHYVAMTRPTHLLCLAMKERSLSENKIQKLQSRWRVGRVTSTGMLWLKSNVQTKVWHQPRLIQE